MGPMPENSGKDVSLYVLIPGKNFPATETSPIAV
jgi:hypothetical protein